MHTWANLQAELVATLGIELEELVHHLSVEDVDWRAGRSFDLEGRSPHEALDTALWNTACEETSSRLTDRT